MRINAEVEASEYGNKDKATGVPHVVGDMTTISGWHLNVFLRDRRENDPGHPEDKLFEYLVFCPRRQQARGLFLRTPERDWRLLANEEQTTLGELPADVEARLKDLADEFEVVLTGLGQ